MIVLNVWDHETEDENFWVIHDDFQVVSICNGTDRIQTTIEHGGIQQIWEFYVDGFERMDAPTWTDWSEDFIHTVHETTDEWVIRNGPQSIEEMPKWDKETERWVEPTNPDCPFPNPKVDWEEDYNRMKVQRKLDPNYDGENPAVEEYAKDRADRR